MVNTTIIDPWNIWIEKSEIEYIPLFISLWFAVNSWMRDRFTVGTDRERLELVKGGRNELSDKFGELIPGNKAEDISFKGHLADLHRALVNTEIKYDNWPEENIRFDNCIIDWNNGNPIFESIIKKKKQQDIREISENLYFEGNNVRVFAAYIEIIYQVRCALFHGELIPNRENERVIKQIYLTLSIIMKGI